MIRPACFVCTKRCEQFLNQKTLCKSPQKRYFTIEMEHPTLSELRKSVGSEARTLIDYLWSEFLASGKWPVSRIVHSRFETATALSIIEKLTGNVVLEQQDPQHGSRYELTGLGVLLCSSGDKLQRLLATYVEYLYYLFKNRPEQTTVSCKDFEDECFLDEAEAVLVGKLIPILSLYSGSCSYGGEEGDWQASVMRDVEHLTEKSDFSAFVEECAFKLYGIHKSPFIGRRSSTSITASPGIETTSILAAVKNESMPDPLKRRYQVFVSSTYDDLKEERRHVMQALLETFCIPTGMELFPAADEEQMKLIKRMIDDCDYYVVIVAGRYGTISSSGKSYTEMEFDYAVSKGKPVMAFYHSDLGCLSNLKSENTDLGKKALQAFTSKVKNNRLCKSWTNADGLASAIKTSVINAIVHSPQPGWVRASDVASAAAIAQFKEAIPSGENPGHKGKESKPSEKVELNARIEYYVLDSPEDRWSKTVKLFDWECSKTLDDIFQIIAPRLHEERNGIALKKILNHKLIEEAISVIPKAEGKHTRIVNLNIEKAVFDRCLQTFLARKLLKRVPPPRDIRLKEPYWKIASKGVQKLAELQSL